MARLGRAFFERYSPAVARELLGCVLVRVIDAKRVSGLVVETEAYRGAHDPASHAYRGKTKRNDAMFGPAGRAYVYFTMGAHHCLNVTAEEDGTPAAVLLRAVQPVDGIDMMRANRGLTDPRRLASGPGNLTRALGIDGTMNGEDLVVSRDLFFEAGPRTGSVGASSRVGISVGKNFKWRFYFEGNPYVSKGRPAA